MGLFRVEKQREDTIVDYPLYQVLGCEGLLSIHAVVLNDGIKVSDALYAAL